MSNDNDYEFLYPAGDPKIRKAWEELGKRKPTKYNKLVRDKIPEIKKRQGEKPKGRLLTDDREFLKELKAKLFEEAKELCDAETRDKQAEEFVDVQDTINTMQELLGFTKQELSVLQRKKAKKKGLFKMRYFLEES